MYKEIQNGAVAKSYITNGLLIYGEIFAHFLIYDFATALLNFLIYEEIDMKNLLLNFKNPSMQ
jgi:hypothetical protein